MNIPTDTTRQPANRFARAGSAFLVVLLGMLAPVAQAQYANVTATVNAGFGFPFPADFQADSAVAIYDSNHNFFLNPARDTTRPFPFGFTNQGGFGSWIGSPVVMTPGPSTTFGKFCGDILVFAQHLDPATGTTFFIWIALQDPQVPKPPPCSQNAHADIGLGSFQGSLSNPTGVQHASFFSGTFGGALGAFNFRFRLPSGTVPGNVNTVGGSPRLNFTNSGAVFASPITVSNLSIDVPLILETQANLSNFAASEFITVGRTDAEDDNGSGVFNGASTHVCVTQTGAGAQAQFFAAPMRGVDASNNRFMCLDAIPTSAPQADGPGATTFTTGNFRYSGSLHPVHVCPAGKVMVGWHEGNNWLICASLPAGFQVEERSHPDGPGGASEPAISNRFQSVHVCDGTDAHSVMVGIHEGDNVLICSRLLFRSHYLSGDSGHFEDDNSQGLFNGAWVHVCGSNTVMSGVDAGNNRFMCLVPAQGTAISSVGTVDTNTAAQIPYNGGLLSVHVCPAGKVMVGWHEGNNWLICAPPSADMPLVDATAFADGPGDQALEPTDPTRAMHVCNTADSHAVMVGIHEGENVLVCRYMHMP